MSHRGDASQLAKRSRGVCMGNLWRKEKDSKSSYSYEFCVLRGATLMTYENVQAYQRGDYPIVVLKLVGASAWNPTSNDSTSSSQNNNLFRLVTNQGSFVYANAPTLPCRDVWLGALHAGLDRALNDELEQPKQQPLQPPMPIKTRLRQRIKKYCVSCGRVDGTDKITIQQSAIPFIQYGKEHRCDVCPDCLVSQGLLYHMYDLKELHAGWSHERKALLEAQSLCWKAIRRGQEEQQQHQQQQQQQDEVGPEDEPSSSALHENSPTTTTEQWVHIPATPESTKELIQFISTSPDIITLQRISPTLDNLCGQLQEGAIDVAELLEQLDEAAGGYKEVSGNNNASAVEPGTPTAAGTDSNGIHALKKQAFRVAGDMGTAMKLLLEHALPRHEHQLNSPQHLDMFQCLLEFFLDLCQEGELASVAFFWSQLCHIHLLMLPATNISELQRVELMEDFLLTVCTKYSIHLALELIWSHTADLEDSITAANDLSWPCRRRRFAVLRFVCEVESLLFGFENGWGGGSVSLRRLINPGPHQEGLLRQYMIELQDFRRVAPSRLTRSTRMQVLELYHDQRTQKHSHNCPTEEAVEEALRVARNADYFSSHLNFTRRICDIAEKLRFMDVKLRAGALVEELQLLNASGTMGGDPLNRVRTDDCYHKHLRIIRVPKDEGHVFRSKERTPVLLLAEVFEDSVEEDDPSERRVTKTATFGTDNPDAPTEASAPSDERRVKMSMDDIALDEDGGCPQSPSPSTRTLGRIKPSPKPKPSPNLDGSANDLDESSGSANHTPHALKRFDFQDEGETSNSTQRDPVTPNVETVEGMLTQVMVKQLRLPDLGIAEEEKGSDTDKAKADGETQNDESEVTTEQHEEANEDQRPPPPTEKPPDLPSEGTKQPTEKEEPSPLRNSSKHGISRVSSKKMSALSSADSIRDFNDTHGDVRREVLNAIFLKGIQGGNTIAVGTSSAVQLSLQELEHKRAVELLMEDGTNENGEKKSSNHDREQEDDQSYVKPESSQAKINSAGLSDRDSSSGSGSGSGRIRGSSMDETEYGSNPTEEDEALEALRLLLIENRVAQGGLSPIAAAKVLSRGGKQSEPNDSVVSQSHMMDGGLQTCKDIGEIDSRLAGCGEVSPAVQQALTMWKAGVVTNGELLEIVKKDLEHGRQTIAVDLDTVAKLNEDSAFWGRFAFGERWAEKKSRIALSSPHGQSPGWDLLGVIVKSNDDLRQEAFVMQLIELCEEAFQVAGLELWVFPYKILATGRTTGIIEMVRNAMSFDALKKRPGYGKGGLREHLQRMTEYSADPAAAIKAAQHNFVRSLAAYSLLSYFFLFKDRHNGNILLDTAGHVIHIDFGFVFGVAPGGSFSLEMSTPFKLTEEMLDVMGGMRSPLFSEFVTLFCCGFLALQAHSDTFLTLVEITSRESTFKCFDGRDSEETVSRLRERFRPELTTEATVAFALDLIKQATSSYGTKQYDYFQYLSQGIAT